MTEKLLTRMLSLNNHAFSFFLMNFFFARKVSKLFLFISNECLHFLRTTDKSYTLIINPPLLKAKDNKLAHGA